MKKRTLAQFEAEHGGSKIRELQQRLETERAKVEAIAGKRRKIKIEETTASFVIGITGDRHVGSLYHHGDALAAYYECAKAYGVPHIYDVGDVLTGHKVYRGHEYEVRDFGLEAQIARLRSESPKSIPTSFIVGNHDESFRNGNGAPIGQLISEATGYEHLGDTQARVEFRTPAGVYSLELLHPGGGSAYALSYKPQKIVESLEGGTKPNMLAIGHYHKAELIPSYRNVCTIQAGTFERQTPFMARNGLAAHLGGWIIEVTVGAEYTRVRGEFIAFY